MRLLWTVVWCALAVPIAAAEPYYRRPVAVAAAPGPEGLGCYWYRQRYYCARYCYVEVNGKRYCQEREREAYPQGLIEQPAWWPLK